MPTATMTEFSREDLNNIIKIASGKQMIMPNRLYRKLYERVGMRRNINIFALAEKYNISGIDVLENQKLIHEAARTAIDMFGVKYDK